MIEYALAHRLRDEAEAAYARGDLFTKRRRLMADWAGYVASPPAGVSTLTSPRARFGGRRVG